MEAFGDRGASSAGTATGERGGNGAEEAPMQETTDEAERARLEALHRYAVLDTLPEPVFDDLTALAADITGSPTALITFVDDDRQWFKSVLGFPFTQSDRSISFCDHTPSRRPTSSSSRTPRPTALHRQPPGHRGSPRSASTPARPSSPPTATRSAPSAASTTSRGTSMPGRRDGAARLAHQVVRGARVPPAPRGPDRRRHRHQRSDDPHMLQAILDGSPAAIISREDTTGRFLARQPRRS